MGGEEGEGSIERVVFWKGWMRGMEVGKGGEMRAEEVERGWVLRRKGEGGREFRVGGLRHFREVGGMRKDG